MRIIGGKFKKKKILFINSSTTRPLRDYVRENVFNIISHSNNANFNLDGACVLDIYAGIGSFGLECLSRNVSKVVFVEKDDLALSILKKNIINLKILNKVKLVSKDIKNYIENVDSKVKFDLIFLDPPYKDNSYLKILQLIKQKKMFNSHHKIIIHREKKSNDNFDKILNIDLLKNYGRSKIIFGSF